MYFAFDYFSVTSPKRVKFHQLDEFRQEVLENYNVSEIDMYFLDQVFYRNQLRRETN